MKDLKFKYTEKIQNCMTVQEFSKLEGILLDNKDTINSNFVNWVMNNRDNFIKPARKVALKEVAFKAIRRTDFFAELMKVKPLGVDEKTYCSEEVFYKDNFDSNKIFINGNKKVDVYTNEDDYFCRDHEYFYDDIDKILEQNLNFDYINQTIDIFLSKNGFKKYSVKGYFFPLWMLNQQTFIINKKDNKFNYRYYYCARDFLRWPFGKKAVDFDNYIIYMQELTDEEKKNFSLREKQESPIQEDEDDEWIDYVDEDYDEYGDEQD